MDTAAELREAAARFFPGPRRVVPLGSSSGFSGSEFARVEADGRAWCLRRWPAGFAAARLASIHRTLRRSRALGFAGVPPLAALADGGTVLTMGDALFDAQGWMPGMPLDGTATRGTPLPNRACLLSSPRLATLATALADFHRSTDGLHTDGGAVWWPLARQFAAARDELAAARATMRVDRLAGADPADRAVAERWLAVLPRAVALASAVLHDHDDGARDARTLCHGDLWAAHVFFDGAAFSGLVDFEGLAYSSAATDLVQLILHFGDWPGRTAALRAYETARPLHSVDRAVLPAAALLDLVGEGRWSVVALYGDEADPPGAAAHRHNLRLLLPSLEALVDELAATGR